MIGSHNAHIVLYQRFRDILEKEIRKDDAAIISKKVCVTGIHNICCQLPMFVLTTAEDNIFFFSIDKMSLHMQNDLKVIHTSIKSKTELDMCLLLDTETGKYYYLYLKS